MYTNVQPIAPSMPMSYMFCSLVGIDNHNVITDGCDINKNFDLIECDTSVLDTPCSTDDVAWVQCTRGSEFHVSIQSTCE